jgi:UDP-N-acetylmuramoylalanine--D-glutamate ligase
MKRISIIGLGRSGEVAAKLAQRQGYSVFVSDYADNTELRIIASSLKKIGIDVELGENSDRILQSDEIVLSPGVPLDIPILEKAKMVNIPIIGEVEFAFSLEKGRIVAVTGSNGKSTTATLIAKMFEDSGLKTFLAGNVGLPYSTIVKQTNTETVTVLEVSSFQLETMKNFNPYVAILLNLTPDHLDRYPTVEDYYNAKLEIFDMQRDSDYSVINFDLDFVKSRTEHIKSKKLYFSTKYHKIPGAFVSGGNIYRNNEKVIAVNNIGITGPHNLSNALAAVATTIPFGVPVKFVAEALAKFEGLEHRLENFLEWNNILFVNDSKATNPDSLRFALLSFSRPIILIAGGYDKGMDFSGLREIFAEKVKSVVFTGETAEKLSRQLGNTVPSQITIGDFKDAVQYAVSIAESGDIVMLSPGCASFDAFKNFEHRGKVFKEHVRNIIAVKQ